MESAIHVLNMNVESIPLDSTITVEDSEAEAEVIDLESTGDTSEITCLDDNSKNTESSSPEDVDINTEITIRLSKDLQSIRSNDDTPQAAFKVMFRDESVSRRYRQQIKDFLYTLVQSKPSYEDDANESSLVLEIWDNKDNFKEQESFVNTEDDNILNNRMKSNDSYDSLFTIDNRPNKMDNLDVPIYGHKYKGKFEESDSETPKVIGPKFNCFNCNGNHNMRDCALPRNHANIKKNRKEFITKCSTGNRYHLSDDQRFSHMIPGQMSSKLRKALGLKDNQLPKHVYRMRLLGYPPGWLEEARLQYSGLSLFNSDGVAETEPNEEEGEIVTDVEKDRYDLKRIYDFPGFNVPPPPGTIDDSDKHWAPQIQPMHSKEMMLLHLQGKEIDDGYKRKKLKLNLPVMNTLETSSDMEIEDVGVESVVENVPINWHFVPPLPKDSVQTPPVPPPSESFQPIIEDSDSQSQEVLSLDSADETTLTANSPSISDLENTKKEILIELDDTSSQSNSDLNISSVSDMSFSNVTTPQLDHSTTSEKLLSTNNDSIKSDLEFYPDTPLKNDVNTPLKNDVNTPIKDSVNTSFSCTSRRSSDMNQASVKSVHLGTPVLPRTSPYNKLPPSEKFSKNICDVLNFENLPDSTGKYEQMTGVLQKVRSTMAKLNQET